MLVHYIIGDAIREVAFVLLVQELEHHSETFHFSLL
jgi:hypothetical protein